jgi:predicted amidohydrolase
MRDCRVACGQFNVVAGNKKENLNRMYRQSREALAAGCDLILFGEVVISGYLSPSDMASMAEPIDGEHVGQVAGMARDLDIAIAFGFAERTSAGCYNALALFNRRGEHKGTYRKVHLWDTERQWAGAGNEVFVVDWEGNRAGGWICHDTRFPEVGRLVAVEGGEMALVPTAWLGPEPEWDVALRSRALDNAMYVLGADLINPVAGARCSGYSRIVDPHGRVIAAAVPDSEGIVVADLKAQVLETQRRAIRVFEDRRPDVYRPLTS